MAAFFFQGKLQLMQRAAAWLMLAGLCAGTVPAALAQDAQALRAKHDTLRARLADNPFRRPMVLESTEGDDGVRGEVYAVVEQPFDRVAPALEGTEHWCELLILHLNVKRCSASGKAPGEVLALAVGRKFDQPIADAYKVDFRFALAASAADYQRVSMSAQNGPLGTRDYRLALEIVPLDAKRSFVHMSYAYAYGFAANMAMKSYLATAGRDKIGFSITGSGEGGKPVFVGGLRGVIERNSMRYYLAIEAYLGALTVPPAEQLEKRLRDWYAATERYPAQLHEMERDEYLMMKRSETRRQRAAVLSSAGAERAPS